MKSQDSVAYFVIIISTILILIFLITNIFNDGHTSSKPKDSNYVNTTQSYECLANETEPCKINGCNGTKECINGRWTHCKVISECIPGETEGCHYDQCRYGIKTCNDCGKWGPCRIT